MLDGRETYKKKKRKKERKKERKRGQKEKGYRWIFSFHRNAQDKIRMPAGKHGFQRIESALRARSRDSQQGEREFSLLTPKETLDLRWIERTSSLHAFTSSAIVRASSGVEQLPDSVLHAVGSKVKGRRNGRRPLADDCSTYSRHTSVVSSCSQPSFARSQDGETNEWRGNENTSKIVSFWERGTFGKRIPATNLLEVLILTFTY